jgi:hypothetical protein
MSLEYQGEIYNTRIDRCEAWMKNAFFFIKTFSEFKKQNPLTHPSPHSLVLSMADIFTPIQVSGGRTVLSYRPIGRDEEDSSLC